MWGASSVDRGVDELWAVRSPADYDPGLVDVTGCCAMTIGANPNRTCCSDGSLGITTDHNRCCADSTECEAALAHAGLEHLCDNGRDYSLFRGNSRVSSVRVINYILSLHWYFGLTVATFVCPSGRPVRCKLRHFAAVFGFLENAGTYTY